MQKAVETLIAGWEGRLPDLNMTPLTIAILGVAIGVKLVLWFLCSRIASNSPSADALAQVRLCVGVWLWSLRRSNPRR